jgi:ataxia telangiectasia mutated family protein
MDGISIEAVLVKIESTKSKDKKEGLRGRWKKAVGEALLSLPDLQSFLNQNRRDRSLKDLKDRAYSTILSSIFQLVLKEKTTYAKPSKVQKQQASSLLSEAASVVRLTVEVGLKGFRQKTVRLIITHIIVESLDGNHYCEPLVTDYIRTLRTLLEYQPHAEHIPAHIPEDLWFKAIDFCNGAVHAHTENREATGTIFVQSQREGGRLSRSSTPSTFNRSVTPARPFVPFEPDKSQPSQTRQLAEEGAVCLYYLLSVSHAPVLEVAQACADTCLDYLKALAPLERPQGQEYAFRSLNRILFHAITENIHLTIGISTNIVPHIRRFWVPRANTLLKDEMLITLLLVEPLIPKLSQQHDWDGISSELRGLMQTLRMEYARRNEKDLLHQDELNLELNMKLVARDPLNCRAFCLRSGWTRSEHSWTLLRFVAVLCCTFSKQASTEHGMESEDEDGVNHRRKRRKVEQPIEELLADIASTSGPERIAYIQLLAFVAGDAALEREPAQKILRGMLPLLSNPSTAVANWATLVATA